MTAATTLYSEVVEITEDYLGPAADRFIGRQITFHLNKKPENLTKDDLVKLVEWVKVSLSLLTDDHKSVEAAASRILALKG